MTAWARFWQRGGGWNALLLLVGYCAGSGIVAFTVASTSGTAGLSADVGGVLLNTTLPAASTAALLVTFTASIGWLRELFRLQPPRGRREWMWVAVGVMATVSVFASFSANYGRTGLGLFAAWLLTGLLVGLGQQLLTQGLIAHMLRAAGHGEIAVSLVTAGAFATLTFGSVYLTNVVVSGQSLVMTMTQLACAFAIGICMYVTSRATRTLWGPILLYAIFYPNLSGIGATESASTLLVTATGFALFAAVVVTERRKRPRSRPKPIPAV